jgi:hypothetical protein
MTVEVKTRPGHPSSMSQRIADRLRNSGEGAMPDEHTVHGSGPTRTHTNVHHAGHYTQPNTQAKPTSDSRVDVHPDSTRQTTGGNG